MPTKATGKVNQKKRVVSGGAQQARSAVHARPLQTKGVAKWNNPSKPNNQNNVYTLSEFVENIRGYCGLESRSQAKALCEDIARFIKDGLKKGYTLPLFGLGKLLIRQTKPRMTRNPQTGEMMKIPARKRIRFSPNKVLKDLIK
ncbi:MAG: HU family DNA-binding protein [Deltaproteobacteria bacterium]|nr:HU family DNA-binding protein [Deltaproteobacteria bacterium]